MPKRPRQNPTQPEPHTTPEERAARIEAWMPRVRHIVATLNPRVDAFEFDDWLGEAALILIAAVDTWTPAMGVPFHTYLYNRLRWDLEHVRFTQLRHKRDMSLKLEDVPDWEERAPHHEDPHRDTDIDAALSTLAPVERAILWAYYGEERTEAEIAQALGRSWGCIHKRRRRALDELRRQLNVTLPETQGRRPGRRNANPAGVRAA